MQSKSSDPFCGGGVTGHATSSFKRCDVLDHIVHNTYRLSLNGHSMRMTQSARAKGAVTDATAYSPKQAKGAGNDRAAPAPRVNRGPPRARCFV